jgi:protein gp37
MSDITKISWTDHTWNPWMGCTRVSPGCAHCYAETAMTRYGRDFSIVQRTKSTWKDPLRWQKEAEARGVHERVFTCSWSDFFHETADPWRGESGPGFRPMEHAWARDIRDQCLAAGVAFFFKQSSAPRTEMGTTLDGREWKEYPL